MMFGGDYNPEQWPAEVRRRDVELMREAGVTLVTVGVFAWSRLQPGPDEFDFGLLDEVLDRLDAAGIGVCLATPTASPPPWFTRLHPDAMPVTREGVRLTHGSRDTYCVNAPAYRRASTRIAAALGERYGRRVRLWHVHNEYGTWCYCDHCAVAFRSWLAARYSTSDGLNDAWSTDFWSQRYGSFDDVLPPRATQYLGNPAHLLDYRRFLSDAMLGHYIAQRDVLRAVSAAPVTTNFVLGDWVPVDHARWAREVDLVAIDDYPAPGADQLALRAFAADRARGWARAAGHLDGRWLLMEHAPGAAGNRAAALTYLDRGAVGVMYFQWRASRGGAEQWHPAMLGPGFAEICALGAELDGREPVTVAAEVALVFDELTWWALQSPHLPEWELDYPEMAHRWHAASARSSTSSPSARRWTGTGWSPRPRSTRWHRKPTRPCGPMCMVAACWCSASPAGWSTTVPGPHRDPSTT
jgi:beta-galactosidase